MVIQQRGSAAGEWVDVPGEKKYCNRPEAIRRMEALHQQSSSVSYRVVLIEQIAVKHSLSRG
jgi:hypothetical protein